MRNSKWGWSVMAMMVAVGFVPGLMSSASAQEWKLGVGLVPSAGGGVRIVRVFDGSPAQAVGLRSGHVILTIDGTLYNDPMEVRNKIFNESGASINIIYQEGGSFYQVTADLEVVSAVVTDAYSGRKVTKKKMTAKGLQKKRVADPRRFRR